MLNFKLSIRKSLPVLCLLTTCGAHSQAQDRLSGENSIHDSLTIQEVIVTGRHSTLGANHVQQQLGSTAITRSMGKSLASLLENISGMSSIQTGTIVAKPVIHGMYGNRILLMSNDARLTGQQWGSDHAPEVDKNGYSTIEVVKGAESVKYGSEALGGIILMNQSPLPYGQQQVRGKVSSLYGSNGRRFSLSGYAEGTMSWDRHLAWRVHANWENGGDRSTAHYLLNNTGLRENDVAVNLGYDRGRWRTEIGYSYFSQKLGVMQSAQMGNEQLLQERVQLGRPVIFTPFSRKIGYPHQKIDHHTAFAKISLHNEALGDFVWQTTFQKDDRRENRIRRMNHSDIPTVSLHLQSLQNTLTWKKSYNNWQSEGGLQLINTENHSERGTGVVPIIPNYTELAGGAYFLQKLTRDTWGMEGGLRGDLQHTEADGYDWTGQRYGGKRDFYNLTYSLGAHYRPCRHWTMTTNFGVAWRAPHVYELYSNGNELSSGMFVKGDSTLRSEQSYKWIASLQYSHPVLSVRLDAYLQWINNYIYDQPTRRNIIVVSGAYPVFQYRQTKAYFRGVDLDLHLRPVPQLDYHVVTALIWGNERTTHNYLPYIPSTRLTHSLSWKPQTKAVITPHAGLTHRYVAKQTRFDPATDLVAFTPPAYHLLGFEAGIDWRLPHQQALRLTLAGDNLLNKEYKEYTNRSRYYAHDMGRDIRCIVTWTF
ncbi:TonB-dependent receptor [Prevotella sp. A2931]|uniref:TonB-dependent receptor n=1 Tax=Prevotella illustrans TaxID=2800387 RepID=A0ABS3M676_9BACT|nr:MULTISPECIES: TonB-dependent receptor [Prevotella]MBO1363620.1 TonB-dependent receptor [Prevotella illustrans]PTL27205.1 TonB-dependent receptor [Prevotella sp. oral taxon 820]